MNRKLWMFIMLFCSISLFAQKGGLKGVIIDSGTKTPISGVTVLLKNHNASAVTDENGVFIISNLPMGADKLLISSEKYFPYEQSVIIKKDGPVSIGKVTLIANTDMGLDDNFMLFDDSQFDEDGGSSTQSVSYLSGAADDVYLSAARYSFSPMRFNLRGYSRRNESTYINGVNFNDLERGSFNYSSLGGLNDAMRNKDLVSGLELPGYAYGNLGSITNINTRASAYPAGTKVSASYSNRAYTLRGQALYSTGLMENGWAFTASTVYRWSDQGIVEGTFYNSWGYFLAAEKVLNENHRISLTTFGAPTKRAQQGATVQEVFDYRGIYYNPYWGYQNGEKRNSRTVSSFDPTAIFNWDWKINETSTLKTGVGFHYSMYSNTALGFYNAPDPRPDYYRNLPSYQTISLYDTPDKVNTVVAGDLEGLWRGNNTQTTQIDWNELYQANLRNNAENPMGSARYMLERRHNNLMETMLNSTYRNQINQKLRLTAGIGLKYTKGMHYKTVDDLLSGKQWIDIDQFAERDFKDETPNIIKNDVRDNAQSVIKKEGDIFGYNYDMNIIHASAFAQNDWKLRLFDIYYAAQITYTQFQRNGHMENGRAYVIGAQSLGKGKSLFFIDPSVKAGIVYKINGRHRLSANVLAETRSPLPYNSYLSVRIKDTQVKGLKSEQILSYDLNYMFNTPIVKGRVTAFQTHMLDGVESTGYYHDGFRTFVNQTLSGVDKVFRGVEAGISIKLPANLTLALSGTYGDYRYTNNAKGVMSAESGIDLGTGQLPSVGANGKPMSGDIAETVYTKDLMVSNGPQIAAAATLKYFHPKMWFVDVTLSYFDKNYLNFSPFRFTKMNYVGGYYKNEEGLLQKYDGYTPEQKKLLGTQTKLSGGFLLDASVGKVIYFNGRSQSLNVNLSLNNILNNTDMITGGFQQARLSRDNKSATKAIETVNSFPNKYYYAWGFNLFLNVGYKF